MIIKPLIVRTNKPNIPSEEVSKEIVFKRPFPLNIAVKNEPISSDISINMSHESDKIFNDCGIIKTKTINAIIIINETMLKYLLIALNTPKCIIPPYCLGTVSTNIHKHLLTI